MHQPRKQTKMYVVIKATREYFGGTGYEGISCYLAGIEQGKIYSSLEEAKENVIKLQKVNPVGWDIYHFCDSETTFSQIPISKA